jgi:hypothetical protein
VIDPEHAPEHPEAEAGEPEAAQPRSREHDTFDDGKRTAEHDAIDDGKRTAEHDAIDDGKRTAEHDVIDDGKRTGEHDVIDDGKRTVLMDSIDPALLGVDAAGEGDPGDDDGDDGDGDPVGELADQVTIPDGAGLPVRRKKRKSRR